MTSMGIFAGRGDVVLAMVLAMLVGAYIGYQARRIIERIYPKFMKK